MSVEAPKPGEMCACGHIELWHEALDHTPLHGCSYPLVCDCPGFHEPAALPAVIRPPELLPGGYTIEREIPGVGLLTFEDYPIGGWMTKRGEPAKIARRRYLLDGVELDSVSSIVGALDKPALMIWIEQQATLGAVQAERLGELLDVPEEDWVKRVKSLGMGASAKRDEGADRGTIIHAAFHSLATTGSSPNPAEFPALARPWLRGAVGAWFAMDPEMVAAEQIVCCSEHGFAGRYDLLAMIDGHLSLCDWKTGRGRVFDQSHWQVRLYCMALAAEGVDVERACIVGIGDDGGFEIIDCAVSDVEARELLGVFRARKLVNASMANQRRIAKAAA